MNIFSQFKQVLLLVLVLAFSMSSFAASSTLTPSVSMTTGYWNSVSIKLTNNSSGPIDLTNAVIQFDTPGHISNVYGDFSAISYPTINLTSTKFSTNAYHNVVSLVLPTGSWVISKLAVNKSITLQFGFSSLTNANGQPILPTVNDIKNIVITLGNLPVTNGSLVIKTPVAPGTDVASQQVAVTINGPGLQQTINMNWASQKQINNLSYGTYTVTGAKVGQYIAPPKQQVAINSASAVTVTLGAYTKPAPSYATVNIALPTAPVSQAPVPAVFLQNVTAGTAAQ